MGSYIEITLYGGTDIADACQEAIRLATKLSIDVWFNFNDIRCLARPEDNVDELVEAYHRQVRKPGGDYKIASTPIENFYKQYEEKAAHDPD